MNSNPIQKIALAITMLALLVVAIFFTRSAGRGACPKCGYQNDLHACKHCGWTACLACWQTYGKFKCPGCQNGNP